HPWILGTVVANARDRTVTAARPDGRSAQTERAVAVAVDKRFARSVAFATRQDFVEPGDCFTAGHHRQRRRNCTHRRGDKRSRDSSSGERSTVTRRRRSTAAAADCVEYSEQCSEV